MSSTRHDVDRESSGGRRKQLLVVLSTVILVIAVTLVIVAVTDGGGALTPDSEQFRPVQVDGDPLEPFGGDTLGDPALGAIAPVISGASFDGSPVVIGPGSPTLVVFLAHWCPHCQAEVPMLVEWAESLRVPFGLDVFAVATATSPDRANYPPSLWLERERFPFPVLADDASSTAAAAFGTTGFPQLVMLSPAGEVMWRYSGRTPDGLLEQLIAESLAALG